MSFFRTCEFTLEYYSKLIFFKKLNLQGVSNSLGRLGNVLKVWDRLEVPAYRRFHSKNKFGVQLSIAS